MRTWLGVVLASISSWPGPGVAQPAGKQVYIVHTQRALHATREGRQARERLERWRTRKQAQLNRWTRELQRRRSRATGSKGQRDAKALAEEERALLRAYAKAKARLERDEQRTVASLVAKLEATLSEGNRQLADGVILDDRRHRFSTLPTECDRTEWLVAAHQGSASLEVTRNEACRFRAFGIVDMQRVMNESLAGKASFAGLKRQRHKMQAKLDRRLRSVRQLEAKDGGTTRRSELQQLEKLHEKFQKQLQLEQEAELSRFLSALRRKLAQATRATPGVLFLSMDGPGAKHALEPSCELTDWTIAYLDGSKELTELSRACPFLTQPKTP